MIGAEQMISVIIPTYNRAEKTLRSLESVMNQTYRDLEIIVVDDGSTDNTDEVICTITDKRVRYIKHKTNMGGGTARNTGIINAHGEYIAFQDSDDVWYDNKLEVELNCLLSNNADIVFCKMNKIVDGRFVRTVPNNYSEGFLKRGSNVYGIGTPTLLGKSEVFKTNLFDESLPRFQELELLLRLATRYRIYCCDKALMDTYFDGSANATSGNPQKLLKASTIIHEKYPTLHSDYPENSERIARNLLIQSYRDSVKKNERRSMQNLAVKIDPGRKTYIKFFCAKLGFFPLINKEAKALTGRS